MSMSTSNNKKSKEILKTFALSFIKQYNVSAILDFNYIKFAPSFNLKISSLFEH